MYLCSFSFVLFPSVSVGPAFPAPPFRPCDKLSWNLPYGEVAERLMAPVLKTGIPERVSGVRIPPSPPCTFIINNLRDANLRFL
jgi:hypothetical protein